MEGLHQLQALGQLLNFCFRVGLWYFFTQGVDFIIQIDLHQQLTDRFSPHTGIKIVTKLFQCFVILLIVQQLVFFQRGHTRINHHEAFKIKYTLNITQGHIQQQANTARQ